MPASGRARSRFRDAGSDVALISRLRIPHYSSVEWLLPALLAVFGCKHRPTESAERRAVIAAVPPPSASAAHTACEALTTLAIPHVTVTDARAVAAAAGLPAY